MAKGLPKSVGSCSFATFKKVGRRCVCKTSSKRLMFRFSKPSKCR